MKRIKNLLRQFKQYLRRQYGRDTVAPAQPEEALQPQSVTPKPWTGEDEACLRENYPFYRNFVIAAILGRTECSVRRKAERLGLKKAKKK